MNDRKDRTVWRGGSVLFGVLAVGALTAVASTGPTVHGHIARTEATMELQQTSQDLTAVAITILGSLLLVFGIALLTATAIAFGYWKRKL